MNFIDLMEQRRGQPLRMAFKGLPNDFLAAMIEGLEGADRITPGKLFAGDSGGCIVGVTLRVIDPDFRGKQMPWGNKKSINKAYRELGKIFPKLYTLEGIFDKGVKMAEYHYPNCSQDEVARAVGLWVAREARTELLIREMNSDWLNQIVLQRQYAEN